MQKYQKCVNVCRFLCTFTRLKTTCMKFKVCIAAVLPFLWVSCKYNTPVLPGSGGKTCEVIVVTPKDHWNGTVGDSIRAFFGAIQPGLNQPEPYFDLVNIQPRQFNESEMFRRHRNVLIVEYDAQTAMPGLEMTQDVWAFPQIVMKFNLRDGRDFDSLFPLCKQRLMQAVYAKEYQRIQKVFKADQALNLTARLQEEYGFGLVFPDGFGFAAADRDFGWIRKESKHYGQGIIFSVYPYLSQTDFQIENIITRRNAMCAKIPGPTEGSYMGTETEEEEFRPFSRPVLLNGCYAVETRGLWKLEGDFMGGPFVNYLIADTANARLIMLDAYLYSPRKPKRDLLMQMEGIARSFKLVSPSVQQ